MRTFNLVAGAAGLLLASCAAGPSVDRPGSAADLTFHSPAAASNPMFQYNTALAQALTDCEPGLRIHVHASALPDSIAETAPLPPAERAGQWPIVTTVDFAPARSGGGPSWHRYERANQDLMFVSALYDVALGVVVFDAAIKTPADLAGRRIAVPRRPSSLRLLTEALLGDGWGVLDQVTLVDLPPGEVAAAAARGEIDATSWNLMLARTDGYAPMIPPLLSGGRWLGVSPDQVAAINAAHDFDVALSLGGAVGAGEEAGLVSFRQGLAAWAETRGDVVRRVLACIHAKAGTLDAMPSSAAAMIAWPGLNPEALHPAAADFYHRRGLGLRPDLGRGQD